MNSPRLHRLRRLTPLLVLPLAGLLTLGTLPASAAPNRPTTLTAEARRAGVELGNAEMGWRTKARAQSPTTSTGRTMAAEKAAFTPTGVLGLDVSSHQGRVAASTWTSKGRKFAFVKATEGTSYRNPYFASQTGGADRAGLLHGAYHFASPSGKSGKVQARYFVQNGGGWTLDGRTLPGVLDIEYNPYGSTCYGLSKAKMVSWITDFVTEYKELTTRDVVIYTTTDWWTRCTGNTTKFALTNPLWVARYGTRAPGVLPGGWPVATFWQYTSTPIDQNRFSASIDRLKVLATQAS